MIADQLGVSKSAIYHHVRSKEELLAAALDHALTSLEAVLVDPGARTGEAMARLEHVMRETIEVLTRDLDEVTLLLRLRGNTALERRAMERRRNFDRSVAKLMEEVANEQHFDGAVETRAATRLIFGMINSVVEWYRPEGPLDPDSLSDLVIRLVFQGLKARD
jgi:AcrR family transcriptional regulator